jgi:hypothetical protein
MEQGLPQVVAPLEREQRPEKPPKTPRRVRSVASCAALGMCFAFGELSLTLSFVLGSDLDKTRRTSM